MTDNAPQVDTAVDAQNPEEQGQNTKPTQNQDNNQQQAQGNEPTNNSPEFTIPEEFQKKQLENGKFETRS